MTDAPGQGTAIAGAHSPDWESAASQSRPSKNNCTTGARGAETDENEGRARKFWRRKNRLVDRFLDEMPKRAARPISVRGGQTLREDVTAEKHVAEDARDDLDRPRRSVTWSETLREFVSWYNGYRNAHLRFRDPEGELVRAPMENSHQPRYGDKYYAKIKALERSMLKDYENPYVTMLTFTGSMRNERGGWRCPVDHLRDVIDAWRPDRGRGTYHALRDSLEGMAWEYALVVEKHENGYGHVHVAVFTDGAVTEDTFHNVIDAHLRNCEIAHRDAHNYHSETKAERPISVRKVEPAEENADRLLAKNIERTFGDDDQKAVDREFEAVSNLASYVGEYIGSHGEALLDRSLSELIFRAAAWASGTQRVRFSTGANEMIDAELDRETPGPDDPVVVSNPSYDPENDANNESEEKPYEVIEDVWTIDGIGRVDSEGEDVYELQQSGTSYVQIEDASHLDPPKLMSAAQPRPQLADADLSDY